MNMFIIMIMSKFVSGTDWLTMTSCNILIAGYVASARGFRLYELRDLLSSNDVTTTVAAAAAAPNIRNSESDIFN